MQFPKRSSWPVSLTPSFPFLTLPICPHLLFILPLKYLLHSFFLWNRTPNLSHYLTEDLYHILPKWSLFLMISLLLLFLQSITSLIVRIISTTERNGHRNYVMCPPKTFSSWFWVQSSGSCWQNRALSWCQNWKLKSPLSGNTSSFLLNFPAGRIDNLCALRTTREIPVGTEDSLCWCLHIYLLPSVQFMSLMAGDTVFVCVCVCVHISSPFSSTKFVVL